MKKVLSLVLAVVLVVGLGAVAFAARTEVKVKDLKLGLSGKDGVAALKVDSFDPSPDANKRTYLLFTEDGGIINPLTKDEVKKFKVGVQIRASEGSSVIKNAKIVYADFGSLKDVAWVELNFVDHLVSTSSVDYSVKLYPTVNKNRDRDNDLTVSGSYSNYDQKVGEGDDYVFIGDTPVVEAEDYIKNIEVDLGNGVSIFTRMFEGRKYYGRVSLDISAEDEAIMNQYPDIDMVYKLDTINLNATGDTVKFTVDDNFYIYVLNEDGELVFLGRSNDRVPYYTKYFLSSKELDIEEVIEGEEPTDTEEEPEDVGPTGGDDVVENVNDNPGTGR